MTQPNNTDRSAVGYGTLLLIAGLILVGALVLQGVLLLRVEQPSTGHLSYAGATLTIGPFALLLVVCGMRMMCRRRD